MRAVLGDTLGSGSFGIGLEHCTVFALPRLDADDLLAVVRREVDRMAESLCPLVLLDGPVIDAALDDDALVAVDFSFAVRVLALGLEEVDLAVTDRLLRSDGLLETCFADFVLPVGVRRDALDLVVVCFASLAAFRRNLL